MKLGNRIDWTDENVEKLKQLWADGHSASAIARKLGAPDGRSAVLGKIHRLGLSGRGAGNRTRRTARVPKNAPAKRWPPEKEQRFIDLWNANTPAQHIASLGEFGTEPNVHYHARRLNLPKRTGRRKEPAPGNAATPRAEPRRIAETQVPQTGAFATVKGLPDALMGRHARQCGWPVGDPTDPEFSYCTNARVPGRHYCEGHLAARATNYRPGEWDKSREGWARANPTLPVAKRVLQRISEGRAL